LQLEKSVKKNISEQAEPKKLARQ